MASGNGQTAPPPPVITGELGSNEHSKRNREAHALLQEMAKEKERERDRKIKEELAEWKEASQQPMASLRFANLCYANAVASSSIVDRDCDEPPAVPAGPAGASRLQEF